MRHLLRVGMMLGTAGKESGCEPHYTIKKTVMVFWSSYGRDQASCLEDLGVADVFGL